MIDIQIITIDKVKEKFWRDAEGEYQKRLRPYARVGIEELKATKFDDNNIEDTKRNEGERIEKALGKFQNARVYLLDEKGIEMDSKQFSVFLDSAQKTVFCIAGSLGFSNELKNKYQRISLSKLTFLHEMARVILMEQIYRGVTIQKGKKYHH